MDMAADILEKLNDSQRQAVTSTEGNVRVIAGAGSGKTRALAVRFAYLVNEMGILPGNILCVTFSNKAANEMRRRIHNLTGDNDTGYVCTFHSFCVSVLREDAHAVQYPESFLVLDNSDIDAMLAVIYEQRGLTLRHMTYSAARDMIEIFKMKKIPDYYEDLINMSLDVLYDKYMNASDVRQIIFYGYLYQQKKCFGLDYNDLINFTLHIFDTDGQIRLKWQKRLEYIMIDEFQDIDEPQYKLMKVLCAYHGNLFIVGDPDQTIYTWRGANINFILDFDKDFTNVKTIMMMNNYRSSPQIVAVANSLIDKNANRVKKELIPMLPCADPVLCHHAESAEKQAEWIVSQIKRLHEEENTAFKDIAVLYRAHYVSRVIEEVFIKKNIPYVIYSGVQFFSRAEIKDVLCYLRMAIYKDDLSFLRVVNVPKRNIGQKRIGFLKEYAAENGCSLYDALRANVDTELFKNTAAKEFLRLVEYLSEGAESRAASELLADAIDKSGYEKMLRTEGSIERLDNLAELKQSVYEYESSCGEESTAEHYLAHAALFTSSDSDDHKDKVRLMTIHTAKGLEFPYVFLCGLNEGVFPTKRTATVQAMEEERRLAFVAVTRAQKGLFLSESQGKNFDGTEKYVSRFLLDIDPALYVETNPARESLVADSKDYIASHTRNLSSGGESAEYYEGMRIKHLIFGEGTILETDEAKAVNIIKFDNLPTPRSISYKVKLEKIN